METIQDSVFGNLSYEYGWTKQYSYPFLDQIAKVKLIIPCDEGESIEFSQKEAFKEFEANKNQFSRLAEEAILNYYQKTIEEYRSRLGPELINKAAPLISSAKQLVSLIEPTEIVIQQSFSSHDRVLGLLFNCTWDPDLGLAVKFVNGKIREVGPQDIFL